MTPREGFKFGFLLRCAEEGLTVKQAEARAALALEKRGGAWDTIIGDAYSGIKGLGSKVLGGAPGAIGDWGLKGLAAGAGVSALGGAGLGYGIAKLREGDTDPEEIQRQELIDTYNTQAELARRRALMDAANASRPRQRSHHGI